MAQTPIKPGDTDPGEDDTQAAMPVSRDRSDTTGPVALEPDDLVGRTILDRYKILQRIGEGGMGAVYLALHTIIEKKVVLKVLHGEYGRKQELVDRFLHEAKTASKIRHENVVDITDFGQVPGGTVFIAMEYLKGRDLADVIKDTEAGTLPWRKVKPIALQICSALEEAHNLGVVHRDLKPENIFILQRGTRDDFVKILDFGIAKMTELDESGKRLTRTGMVFGTPEYMAPEQARGEKTDRRVDVYAMGCILYEMMCGDVPFRANSFMGVLTKHIFDPVVAPSSRYPELGVPSAVERVIMKALDKDKDRRFQSMAELAAALEACDTAPDRIVSEIPMGGQLPTPGVPSTSRPTIGPASDDDFADMRPPSNRGLKIAIALVLVVGAAVIATILVMRSGKTKDRQAAAATIDAGASANQANPVNALVPDAQVAAAPIDAQVAPVARAKRKLTIKTEPPGATIKLGKKTIGVTPFTVELDEGQAAVRYQLVLKGYRDGKVDVVPDGDREYVIGLDKASGGKKGGKGGSGGGGGEIKDPFGN